MASATKCANHTLRASPAGCEEPLLLIPLQAAVPRASLRRPAHKRAGIGRQVYVPFATGRVDCVREDAEFAVYGDSGDDVKPFITVGREVRTRECRHPDARERTLRHGFQAKVLIGRASLCRGHLALVALEDFCKREPLRDPSVDDDAFVDLGFDTA